MENMVVSRTVSVDVTTDSRENCVMWRKPWSLAPTIVRIRAIVSRVRVVAIQVTLVPIVRSYVRRVVTLEGDV